MTTMISPCFPLRTLAPFSQTWNHYVHCANSPLHCHCFTVHFGLILYPCTSLLIVIWKWRDIKRCRWHSIKWLFTSNGRWRTWFRSTPITATIGKKGIRCRIQYNFSLTSSFGSFIDAYPSISTVIWKIRVGTGGRFSPSCAFVEFCPFVIVVINTWRSANLMDDFIIRILIHVT